MIKQAIEQFKNNDFSLYQCLHNFYNKHYSSLVETFIEWLDCLAEDFEKRFQDFKAINSLIKFGDAPSKVLPNDAPELAQFIDVKALDLQFEIINYNSELELAGDDSDLAILKNFKKLKDLFALAKSIFPNSYSCESSFSSLNYILNEYRSSLTNENMRDCLMTACSCLSLDFKKIVKRFDRKAFL